MRARCACLLLLLLLGPAAAAAEDWRGCRQRIEAAPKPRRFTCVFDNGQASGDWQRAKRELEAIAHTPEEAGWLANLAAIEDKLAGCSRSEQLFGQAAALYAAAGPAAGELYALGRALRCLEERDPVAALDAGERLAEVAAASGKPALVAQAAIRRAQIAIGAVALEEAETLLAAYSLAELDALDPGRGELGRDWLFQHGRLSYALGRFDAALRDALLRRERAAGATPPDLPQMARASYDAAAILTTFQAGDASRRQIAELAGAALALAERTGETEVELTSLLLLGRLDRDPALLRRCGDRAGEARIAIFAACRFAEADAVAGSDRQRAARALAEGEAAAERSDAPFAALQPWSDRLRAVFALRPRGEAIAAAGELLAEIEKLREAETREGRGAELFGVWRELHDWLAGRLLESGTAAGAEQAFLLLENARARELRDRLGLAAPVRGLREVEAGLGEHEALLSFLLDHERDVSGNRDGGAAVFVSTRAGTRVLPLPGRERLDPAIALWLGEIAQRRDERELARQLGRLLFAEIEKALPAETRRLILVPDGSLFRLPWGLLRGVDGEPLARRYEIAIAPAASLLPRAAGPGAAAALIFADPAFAAADGDGGAAATRSLWGGAERGVQLGRLPLAREEGRAFHRLLGGRLYAGDEAREELLTRGAAGEEFGVLHFAAHALLDDELPERSALLLAPGGGEQPGGDPPGGDPPGGGPPTDGRLEPREIAALRLPDKLVTLAGCRSALGRIVPGEGPMSLGRAFLAAGAPAVLGSLWDLRDDEAADFFGRFYRRLAAGESAAAALAAAQIEMAEAGAPAAAWAGVVLLGDGDFRLAPPTLAERARRRLAGPWPLLLAAALLLLVAVKTASPFRRRK